MYLPGFYKKSSLRTKADIDKDLEKARKDAEETEAALVELSTSGSQHGDAVERRSYLQSLMSSKYYIETSISDLEKELSELKPTTTTTSFGVVK
jgi:hypothetical protein